MNKFSQEMIKKPKHLPTFSLLARIGVYDTPQVVENVFNRTYSKSEMAVNDITGTIQVYVLADTANGLNNFLEAYPNAVIESSSTLENPDDWKLLAFPSQGMPDESTPLDNYYQVRGREKSKE
jgi:hypothetical protein